MENIIKKRNELHKFIITQDKLKQKSSNHIIDMDKYKDAKKNILNYNKKIKEFNLNKNVSINLTPNPKQIETNNEINNRINLVKNNQRVHENFINNQIQIINNKQENIIQKINILINIENKNNIYNEIKEANKNKLKNTLQCYLNLTKAIENNKIYLYELQNKIFESIELKNNNSIKETKDNYLIFYDKFKNFLLKEKLDLNSQIDQLKQDIDFVKQLQIQEKTDEINKLIQDIDFVKQSQIQEKTDEINKLIQDIDFVKQSQIQEKTDEINKLNQEKNDEINKLIQEKNVEINKLNQEKQANILIIMPTYNRSEYIEKSIKIINTQTHNNWVFLIIDDGSSENHKNKFREIKKKYESDKIIFQENKVNFHIAKTLNKGIEYLFNSKTNFTHFTWISDDNEYYPNFLKKLSHENTFFKYGAYDIQELNLKINTNKKQYKDFDDLLNDFKGCASFMWSKEAIEKIGFYDENIPGCEDFEYLLRTFKLNSESCKYIDVALMKYIRHEESLMEKNREAIINMKNDIISKYKYTENKYKYKISIVMAYYNRKPQTLETLKGFEKMYAGKYIFEVIIVDDNSNDENRLEEDIKQFTFPINLIVISKEEKGSRINSCIPYNRGFNEATGEVIIIQNPECLHIGDILKYIYLNFNYDSYLSFPCYNSNNYKVNEYIKNNIQFININNIEEFTKSFNQDANIENFPIWYQHPSIWNKNLHFCTAIHSEYLKILGGFDEIYKDGICFEDDSFIFNIKEILKLNIISINLKENVGVVHQYHGRSSGCCITSSNINIKQNAMYERFLLNENLFNYQKNINKSFDAPKIIHYYWDNFKKFSYVNLYSLKSSVYYNPDFIHIIWIPKNPQENITWNEFCNKDYNQDEKWEDYFNEIKNMKNVRIIYKNIAEFLNVDNEMSEIHKSDLFRYKILIKYGGIWCDLDIVFIKSITDIINFNFDSINFLVTYNSTFLVFPIGFLACKRNSSIFKLIYDTANINYDKNRYQCLGCECLLKVFLNNNNNYDNFIQLIKNKKFKYLDNGYLSYDNNDSELNIIMDNKFYMNFLWDELEELFIENKINKDLSKTVGFHWFNGSNITKKYLKEIIDYTIPDIFNGLIFSEKNKFHSNIKTITYFNIEIPSWGYFYKKYIKEFVNIINAKYTNIKLKEILINHYCDSNNILINELGSNSDELFIFDELAYTHLQVNYHYGNNEVKKHITYFLCRAQYISFFSEVFINNNLETIGNMIKNKEFCLLFFKNAKNIYLCNTKNINYLIENNIYDNITYFPAISYSIINNIVPLIMNKIQEIDILFYGNIIDNFTYRINGIENIDNFAKVNNYNFMKITDLHEDTKSNILTNTKIVIHIPSHEKLHTFPWAKVSELMCNKIFFIIEENEEMYIKNLDKIVIYYKQNDMIDLQDKIKYYLNNESERDKITENCFKYIKNNYNMDTLFDNIIC